MRTSKWRWTAVSVLIVIVIVSANIGLDHREQRIAVERFESITGLEYPEDAVVVSVGEDRGFNGDGEYYLVFKTSRQVIDDYLDQRLFKMAPWSRGPLPKEIRIFPIFGTDGYRDDDALTRLFDRRDVFYSAVRWAGKEGWSGKGLNWANGRILLVDQKSEKVWFSIWDT